MSKVKDIVVEKIGYVDTRLPFSEYLEASAKLPSGVFVYSKSGAKKVFESLSASEAIQWAIDHYDEMMIDD